jgi:hypothetical protein
MVSLPTAPGRPVHPGVVWFVVFVVDEKVLGVVVVVHPCLPAIDVTEMLLERTDGAGVSRGAGRFTRRVACPRVVGFGPVAGHRAAGPGAPGVGGVQHDALPGRGQPLRPPVERHARLRDNRRCPTRFREESSSDPHSQGTCSNTVRPPPGELVAQCFDIGGRASTSVSDAVRRELVNGRAGRAGTRRCRRRR